jgi:hypothetical protein
MASSPLSGLTRSCLLALLLSLSLHGLFGLLMFLLPHRDGREGSPAALDLTAPEPEEEMTLTLREPPRLSARLVLDDPPAPPVAPDPPAASSVPVHEIAPGQAVTAADPTAEPGTAGAASPSSSGHVGTGVGTGTGYGATAFFQVAAQGRAIVYVIDRSASMGLNGALAAARRELLASLDRLPADARFQVIVYNRTPEPLRLGGRTGLAFATPENKQQAAALLEGLTAEGSTEHLPALKAALALDPDVIFFLTDADDLQVGQVSAVTTINHGRTAIHAIELNTANRGREDMPLQVLARDNRGLYQAVDLDHYH